MHPYVRLRIGITTGDPSGIGPEVLLRLLHDRALDEGVQPIVYGDLALMRRVANVCAIDWPEALSVQPVGDPDAWPASARAILLDYRLAPLRHIQPGQIQSEAGQAAATWIRDATGDALAGYVHAIATGPVHKQALLQAGITHPGHTEWLAEMTGAREPVMMFVAPDLVVSLATIHIPLAAVPDALTPDGLLTVMHLTATTLRRRLGREPRIGVLGLNPHGGEGGRFGRAESHIIAPAIAEARQCKLAVDGPLVPDVAFLPENRRRFDAFVAMYHDQALIPFKMLAFDFGVNVTLGLPFIRTSVDHGTAFDIAWQGKASPNSFLQAIRLAAELSRDRHDTDSA